MTLAVRVAPGAERLDGKAHRSAGDERVDRRHTGRTVPHREHALEHDVADAPPPPGQAVAQLEALQQQVTARLDGTGGPLVGAEPDRRPTGRGDDRVQRGQGHHPARRDVAGDDEQAVVAAHAKAADRAHRVAATAVGAEPLPAAAVIEPTAYLRAEGGGHGHEWTSPAARAARSEAGGPPT